MNDMNNQFSDLVVENREAVSWVFLNRPQALNALSSVTMQQLRDVFEQLERRAETRVIVLSGIGRAFCAGADIGKEFGGSAEAAGNAPTFLDYATQMETALFALSKPLIAAVNGICVGGGLELALMCDFIVAAQSARLGDAHANFGAMPGGGATVRLPRLVGPNMARLMMFTGEIYQASDMRDAGLVARLFPDESFQEDVQALGLNIASKSPLGLRRMKQLITDSFDLPTPQAIKIEKMTSAAHMQSWDAAEGGRAFAEKRKPQFRGY